MTNIKQVGIETGFHGTTVRKAIDKLGIISEKAGGKGAGWVDPDFEGNLTLELHSHRPIELSPCQRVVQLVLYVMQMESNASYNGRYQGQRGPTMARIQPIYKGGKIA